MKTLAGIVKGRFLEKDDMFDQLPFIFFLTLLIIIYIGNNHYAEKMSREKENMSHALRELQSEYITTKSELMYRSKQSELAKTALKFGLKEATGPPKKIVDDRGWFE